MAILSTLLLACALHVGTIPVSHRWRLEAVDAPVAEPGVDEQVRSAVLDALAARRALGEDGVPLRVTVVEASCSPARRSGDVLLYEARLAVIFSGEGHDSTRRQWRTFVDPGTAGEGRAAREAAFADLARRVAEDGVSWLLQ